MQTVKVQEFYETEDEHYELGGPREIEVSPEEYEKLASAGAPIWLERLNRTYGLIEED